MEKLNYPNPIAERLDNQPYKALRNEAPGRAEALIARVENFEKVDYREQLIELQSILDTLGEDNGNRFIAEYVAGKMYHIEVAAQEEAVSPAERATMLETPPVDYSSSYILVPQADKQPLSPAAKDQRAPTPALARTA